MLTVLRQRNFALLWTGELISLLGDWILLITLPFYIYQRTNSALATGAMFIAETVPSLLLGSIAGVFVDRWNRRWTMIIADILRALLLLLLLLIQARSLLWLVYFVAFVQSTLSEFFSPAEGALIPHLVDEQQLLAANSVNSLAVQMTRLIGPTLGGVLFGLLGLNSIVLVDSASFAFSALMILLIALPSIATGVHAQSTPATPVVRTNICQEWLEGFQLIRKKRVIAILFLAVGISMIGEGLGRGIFIPFLSKITGNNAILFSTIFTMQGIGAIAGSLLLNHVSKRFNPFKVLAFGAITTGLIAIIEATFPTLPIVIVGTVLVGAPVVFFFVSVYTLLQSSISDQYRGRILGAYSNNNTFMLLLGLTFSTLLADQIGITHVLALEGVLYFLAGVTAFVMLRSQ